MAGLTKTFPSLRDFFFLGTGGMKGTAGLRLPSRASKASHLFFLLTRVETVETESLDRRATFLGFLERRCLGLVSTVERRGPDKSRSDRREGSIETTGEGRGDGDGEGERGTGGEGSGR